MPRPSAFNSTRFSSRPPHGEIIFRQMVRDLGGSENYSDDFDSLAMARVYANAMTFQRVRHTLERAGSQFRPSRALELLPTLEAEYGITPEPGQTISERRRFLAAAAVVARGAKRTNVELVMTELLGDDFVRYEPTSTADAVVTSNDPGDVGIYPVPGTARKVVRLVDSVLFTGTPVTVTYEAATDADTELVAGDVIAVDPGNHGRYEVVTVAAVSVVGSAKRLTATFTKPHTRGAILATGRHPYLMSSKRHNVFVLSEEGARTPRIRRRAERIIQRLLRGVSTWSLTDGSGPFRVGVGKLGITTIGAV